MDPERVMQVLNFDCPLPKRTLHIFNKMHKISKTAHTKRKHREQGVGSPSVLVGDQLVQEKVSLPLKKPLLGFYTVSLPEHKLELWNIPMDVT